MLVRKKVVRGENGVKKGEPLVRMGEYTQLKNEKVRKA